MRRGGFTLIEMLVALLVFGLLAAAGAAVMGSTLTSQAVVKSRVERFADFQRLRATLRADLAQAAPRRTRDTGGTPAGVAFIGGDPWGGAGERLFVVVRRGWENPDQAPRPSLQYVEYRLSDGRLERRVRAALDGTPLGPAQVLIDGVETSQVAFLHRGVWQASWKGQSGVELPRAVRLDLTVEGLGPITQLFLTTGDSR
ncbi:type II secretion system minor pseudopilin GspJ [Caulobacter sp. NIBR1757]|uniref:type II secretion system minor pseudopilin GspJ n=1 Tax=Caulobacter sp. NIBR1757 TaxID=3016000 RepID=UPI0022F11199|nr:type II secretion system minor pseudopilin GspJ [Caulobacter sp. NIBR1757]WGM37649.1 Type II secretion system protein J [Caulobacter sp. NIBR1757]